MKAEEKQSIEMYQRVAGFFVVHPAPAGSQYGVAVQRLTDSVSRLGGFAEGQVSGHQSWRADKQRQDALARSLREDHVKPIVAIAKENVEGHPGIEQAVAARTKSVGILKLLVAAQSIHDAAALYPPVFVDGGCQPDFLDRMQQTIDELKACAQQRGTKLGRQIGSSKGINRELQRARAVLNVLDAFVRSAFRGNVDVLAEWEAASRIKLAPGGRPGQAGTNGAAAAAAGVTTPAAEGSAAPEPKAA